MSERYFERQLLESELMTSSPEHVYAWLKSRSESSANPIDGDEELENQLLQRNSPLLALGLARYGFSEKVVRQLFANGMPGEVTNILDSRLRLAALSNRVTERSFEGGFHGSKSTRPNFLFGENEHSQDHGKVRDFLSSADTSELVALLQNPTLGSEFLASLYAGTPPFDGLDDDRWQRLIEHSSYNSRLSVGYTGEMDGWATFQYEKVFDQAWRLAERVPLTGRWAKVLTALLSKTLPDTLIKDKMSLIRRWHIEVASTETSAIGLNENEEPKSDPLDSRDDFSSLRLVLTRLLSPEEIGKLRKDDDVALRSAFYRFGRPTPPEMKEAYELEPEFFLNNVLWNNSVWQKREARSLLHDLCWSHKPNNDPYNRDLLLYPNYYRERHASVFADHPDWFGEEENAGAAEQSRLQNEVVGALNTVQALLADIQNRIAGMETEENGGPHREAVEVITTYQTAQAEMQKRIAGLLERVNALFWALAILAVLLLLRRL